MKKTAMQILIEEIESGIRMIELKNNNKDLIKSPVVEASKAIVRGANSLLETEREQIEEAYEKGCDNAHDWHSDPRGGNLTAKQYYKDTYQ